VEAKAAPRFPARDRILIVSSGFVGLVLLVHCAIAH